MDARRALHLLDYTHNHSAPNKEGRCVSIVLLEQMPLRRKLLLISSLQYVLHESGRWRHNRAASGVSAVVERRRVVTALTRLETCSNFALQSVFWIIEGVRSFPTLSHPRASVRFDHPELNRGASNVFLWMRATFLLFTG